MEGVRLDFNDRLTDDERSELTKSAKPVVRLTVSDQTALDVVLPPASETGEWGQGHAHHLGLDLDSIFVIAVAAGGMIFLKEIIKESAKDFWIALKGLIARVGARRKAVPMDSLQLQIALEFEDGMLVNFVLTCLHARFV